MGNPVAKQKTRPWIVSGLVLVLGAAPALAGDWGQWLGNAARDRQAEMTPLIAAPTASVLARELWRAPLGSGYSSVSVMGETVVSARADAAGDFVVAFDSASGTERWRFRLEATYEGHDGSHDGPLSTPAIADGRVFALSARGRLVVLDAETGALVWERDLQRQDKAKRPHYGFATSPLVTDGLVVVQGGGRGKSVLAFDAATGAVRWRVGNERVRYSSPAKATLGGVEQVVVAGMASVEGYRLEDGEALWRYEASTGDFTPLPLGADRLLLSTEAHTTVLDILHEDGRWRPQVRWRTGADEGPWDPVVHDDGVVYGLDGDDALVAASAATGEVLWRHAAVNGTLIRVGTYLVLLAYGGGDVHLFAADGDGVRDLGVVASLEQGQSNVRPSFANDVLYLRSRRDLRALRLTAGM